ncbi:MAG TPA: TrkH family potassium uptake protein [Erysipelotrichaceae bacterium]|nr:TrkH family potassium uptake protein [Erysipelotrichaceae bacterium]
MDAWVEKFAWLKRYTPAQQIAMSFAFVITTGALLLWLPISNKVQGTGFIEHLFTSTSAVCVTGLTTIVPLDQYTIFGQFIILLLMQIGGLGLMTLIAVFLIFVGGKLSHAEKLAMSEAVNRPTLGNLGHFLKFILVYTAIFEGFGFVLLSFRFVPQFGMLSGLYKALFVSVSAFCNAGLDNLGPSSLVGYVNDPLVSLTVAALIIMGGLGFGVWFDLTQSAKSILRKKCTFKSAAQHLRLHTKIVLWMTMILLASGTILILVIEFTNPLGLAPLSFGSKLMASFFQSTTLRTAGFSTLTIGNLRPFTQFFMMIYMFIGGSPGGTAGGIKTTTIAILVLMIVAEIKGSSEVVIFNRCIPRQLFRKSFIIAFMMLVTLITGILLLTITEDADFLVLSFEAVSAIATVGLSMGVTASLSIPGKIIIIALMYLGRIGPLTLILSLGRSHHNAKINEIKYPNADILIG